MLAGNSSSFDDSYLGDAKECLLSYSRSSSGSVELDDIENMPIDQLSLRKEIELTYLELDCRITVAVAETVYLLIQAGEQRTATMTASLVEIAEWIHLILTRSQAAPGVIIVALIYLERLLVLNPLVKVTNENWKSLSMIAILLASKIWDDLSMVNADFALFMPFTLLQINDWERAFLRGLRYNVKVEGQVYDDHFHLLRMRASQEDLDKNCIQRLSQRSSPDHQRIQVLMESRTNDDSRQTCIPSPTSSISTYDSEYSPLQCPEDVREE